MAAHEPAESLSGGEKEAGDPCLRCGLVDYVARSRFGLVSDFGSLARKISGWTTNLLATAIVLVGGLAIGWQVLSWWREAEKEAIATSEQEKLAALVPQAEGREFWTKRGLVKVEGVRGSVAEATAAMRAFCRAGVGRAVEDASVSGEAGPHEAQLVTKLKKQQPLEEGRGVSVYQPAGQTGMMVGVREVDQRIVAWSFVMPAEEGRWLVYHFRPSAGSSAESIASKP